MPGLVDVYPYRLNQEPEFLILKRAEGKQYAGQWRMVGGKVEACEAAWQSGLRELREETSVFPQSFWCVPSINHFYEAASDTLHHIPVFAAEIKTDASIGLNHEHQACQWIPYLHAADFIVWPEQLRLMGIINRILTTQKIIDDWKIPL